MAVQTLPLELSIFLAVDAHVRDLRTGRIRMAVAAAAWLLLGLATAQKGAVTPLLLFALTSGFLVKGRWAAAAVRPARRYWRAWVLYGVLLAGYCAPSSSAGWGPPPPRPQRPGPGGAGRQLRVHAGRDDPGPRGAGRPVALGRDPVTRRPARPPRCSSCPGRLPR